ncbi:MULTISPECIES: J domain-containing protein [Haloarcula]|uniref:J domain-containing protein n=1 Tax=Haloarcula TaxID=2237 RepID=UPI0023E840E9|nr:J domain-containing protein [Halomicroarcula sp. SHR3]
MSDVDWPAGFERTDPEQRDTNGKYRVSLHEAVDELAVELDRLDVDDWRLETAMRHQSRNPNYPYANQSEPADSSVVLRWSMDGEQFAVACDAYSRVRDNVRTVGLYVREKRKMEARPVTTGESEFANARLPSGEDGAIVTDRSAHEVLGVDRDATPSEIRRAFRERVKEAHPDHGGSEAELQNVREAREVLLDDE